MQVLFALETREASVCSESSARLIKLSECRGDINDHLQAFHLGQLRGTVKEYELIVSRSGLPQHLSPDQLNELWKSGNTATALKMRNTLGFTALPYFLASTCLQKHFSMSYTQGAIRDK